MNAICVCFMFGWLVVVLRPKYGKESVDIVEVTFPNDKLFKPVFSEMSVNELQMRENQEQLEAETYFSVSFFFFHEEPQSF